MHIVYKPLSPKSTIQYAATIADEEYEIAVVRYHLHAVLLAKYWMLVRRRKRKPRVVRTRQWISRRPEFGIQDQLLVELRREDPKSFKNFLRMEPAMYDEIVQCVGPRVTKKITSFRKPLSPDIKIAFTLRTDCIIKKSEGISVPVTCRYRLTTVSLTPSYHNVSNI